MGPAHVMLILGWRHDIGWILLSSGVNPFWMISSSYGSDSNGIV